jgi:CRISPR-associated endonuclease Cas1
MSPLTKNQRKAVNPANAVLNYLYALLEAEARIAALAVELDPMVGLLHSDTSARDSLAFDLMEPIRPAVDSYLLDLLERRTFTKADFFEQLDGHCRIMPPLTEDLASSVSQ